MIASGHFVDLKGFTDKGLDGTRAVATRADYAKALLPVTELVSYTHWAESWFRYMAAAALFKPEMLSKAHDRASVQAQQKRLDGQLEEIRRA